MYIHKLKRKYGNSVEEMLLYLEKAKSELSEIEFSEERIAALDEEINNLNDDILSKYLTSAKHGARPAFSAL